MPARKKANFLVEYHYDKEEWRCYRGKDHRGGHIICTSDSQLECIEAAQAAALECHLQKQKAQIVCRSMTARHEWTEVYDWKAETIVRYVQEEMFG